MVLAIKQLKELIKMSRNKEKYEKHEEYKDILFGEKCVRYKMKRMQSKNH